MSEPCLDPPDYDDEPEEDWEEYERCDLERGEEPMDCGQYYTPKGYGEPNGNPDY